MWADYEPTADASLPDLDIWFARGSGPDRDDDGLADGAEFNVHGTDPDVADSDADELPDGEEIALGTDPLLFDTDGDVFGDGAEVAAGTNPLDPMDFPSPPEAPSIGPWGLAALMGLIWGIGLSGARRRQR